LKCQNTIDEDGISIRSFIQIKSEEMGGDDINKGLQAYLGTTHNSAGGDDATTHVDVL
jgi:hypothetical protein